MAQLDTIYLESRKKATDLAFSMIKCRQTAEDIVQDVYIELLEKNLSSVNESLFLQYVSSRTKNYIRNRSRETKRNQEMSRFQCRYEVDRELDNDELREYTPGWRAGDWENRTPEQWEELTQ